jgi:hypothetical protein
VCGIPLLLISLYLCICSYDSRNTLALCVFKLGLSVLELVWIECIGTCVDKCIVTVGCKLQTNSKPNNVLVLYAFNVFVSGPSSSGGPDPGV